ncbi:hypothetical protein LX32DRAFT_732943 [Colletotrichum zoysiae]|uniref:Uncharacterized protein n=1 Tax=Colletotrichum zoysiae TaxID=1216348 RepID=A0AAD9H530_9PEZI|nr:hypothetical protein LX32DRAFT_732943 [Colletotrichum zoysiae]
MIVQVCSALFQPRAPPRAPRFVFPGAVAPPSAAFFTTGHRGHLVSTMGVGETGQVGICLADECWGCVGDGHDQALHDMTGESTAKAAKDHFGDVNLGVCMALAHSRKATTATEQISGNFLVVVAAVAVGTYRKASTPAAAHVGMPPIP